MSGVFFNGRKWVSPATMSAVDDSAMNNRNLSVGNVVALVGRSAGGAPQKALRFGSPDQAKATLRDGEMLAAVLKAFDPSSQTNSPAEVICVRVNPAVQAALTLLDSASSPAIDLLSTDFGLTTNQIKVKVEAGTAKGLRLTSQFGNDYYSEDNVARDAFSVNYTGPALTAVMSINGTSLTLQAPSGSTVATLDLNAFATVQQVVDKINSTASFTAAVLDGNATKPTKNGLDYVTAVDVKTSTHIATANLQAAVDWFNSTGEGFIDAKRANNAGKVPVAVGFTYLSGGSDGVVTNADWAAAYTVLQTVDVQWVTPISADPSIWAMNDSHCAFMSNVARQERRGVVGMASGSSDAAALAAAKALNSDRTTLVHIGYYENGENNTLVLQPPYMLAALLAGAGAGVNPGTSLTNKSIKVRGLERDLRNPTDTDLLIEGGVLCVENTNTGYKVVKWISTWLTNDKYNRVEVSTGVAVDYAVRSVREAVDVLRGEKGGPLMLSRAVSLTDSTLRQLAKPEPQGPGVLVGDEENPAFRNITASLSGDALAISFECRPAISTNYVQVTMYAVPYSGSATI